VKVTTADKICSEKTLGNMDEGKRRSSQACMALAWRIGASKGVLRRHRLPTLQAAAAEINDWNFPCQTLEISKVSLVVMGS
jgi:hypothetical protein